jgi:hypothetical protein
MSGILAIIVPILNAGASGAPPSPWDSFIFNDDEAPVAFTLSSTAFVFNLTKMEQDF